MRRTIARPLAGALVAGFMIALLPTAAWAAEGRIQEVQSQPGEVSFVLSAKGLAEGESIDAGSVKVRIGGQDAQATAQGLSQSAAAPTRTVMLVMDVSGSMNESGKLGTAKAAAHSYLDALPADVLVGLVTFADKAEQKVAPTTDRTALGTAIDGLKASGATALNDAVSLTVDRLGTEGSRNAVLLSDGADEGSATSQDAAVAKVTDSGIVLDAVSLGNGDQASALQEFAAAGDGTMVTAVSASALTAAFEQAARTVDTQLSVVASVPAGLDGGTSALEVSAIAGGQEISDSTVAVIELAPVAADPAASAADAAVNTDPGLLGKSWVLICLIVVIFAALLTITVIAVGAMDTGNRREGRVARRLKNVTQVSLSKKASTDPETKLGESAAVRKAVSLADKVAENRRATAIAHALEQANVALRPGEWVIVHGLIALLAVLLTTLLTNFNAMLSILAFGIGLALPWAYLERRASARRAKFYAALPDALQMLAGSLQAGYSLPQSVDNVARETPGPLGEELKRALLESRLGLPLEEALEAVAQRMQSQDFHWVVMSIDINRKIGGNLAEVLANVGTTLRERERLRRQVKTLTAEGVLSAWIVGLLPVAVAGFVSVANPGYLIPLFTTPQGLMLLAVGAVLYVVGILWMRNLVTMEV